MIPLERTSLGRLRADEAYMARRLANISNFGATWLKPPGVAKSLYQMREERREQEEHAEAVRREQLAAELAEAEAAQAAQGMEGMMDVEGGGEGMGEGGVDLDDEIPDADASGMGGFDYDEDSSEEAEDEEEDDDDERDVDRGEEDDDDAGDEVPGLNAQQRRAHQRERATQEDRLRELLARGGDEAEEADIYGVAGEELDEEEAQGDMLEEEDLVHEHDHHLQYDVEPGEDLDMDANLDDEIPEAESVGGYEHTDSEAEVSSSEDGGAGHNASFGAGHGARAPQTAARYRSSLASNATRQSLDISSILDSSMVGSSPQVRRRN